MEIHETDYEILSEVYAKVRGLQKSEKKNGKVKDPSVAQQVHQLIDEGVGRINSLISTSIEFENLRLLAMKITLLYEKSKMLVYEEKENLAEEILAFSLITVNKFLSTTEIIFSALRIMNHYAYLLMKRDNDDEARKILEQGDLIYQKTKFKNSTISFFSNEELFSSKAIIPSRIPSDSCNKLERLVTSNLAMLSMIYGKLELHEQFAHCQHEFLVRQLESSGDELLMWPMKATKLAYFFITKNRFKEARNHLAAATQILCDVEQNGKSMESTDDSFPQKCPELRQKFADVANCWVKYGLTLFNSSKMSAVSHLCQDSNEVLARLWDSSFECPKSSAAKNLKRFDDKNQNALRSSTKGGKSHRTLSSISEDDESRVTTAAEDNKIDSDEGPLILFHNLGLNEYEEKVTASLIQSTEEARILFHHTHTWLKRVKLFYSLQDHPREYVNAIMDLNELYRYLAFYEEDIESQYAVHKLRADTLETLSAVLREVRPQCYMAVSVEILRELAEVQMEMMGLNLRKIYAAQTNLPDAIESVQKIATLHDLNVKLKKFGHNPLDLENSDSVEVSRS